MYLKFPGKSLRLGTASVGGGESRIEKTLFSAIELVLPTPFLPLLFSFRLELDVIHD
jgi:hypothetical protein